MSCKLLRLAAPDAAPMRWREIGSPPPGETAVIPFEMVSGVREPDRRKEPERDWEQEVERARAAGFREGEAAGRERATAEVRALAERLARSLEELATLRPRLRQEAEGDMLRLAMAIARRVLGRELAVDPEALHGLAVAALEKLSTQEIHRVRVHASMVPNIRTLLETMPGRARVEVVPDPAGEPGTIVFETERGNLDASVETQLDEIGRGLADRLGRKR